MNNIIHQGELEKFRGDGLNVHFGPKMAGNDRFFGQNCRNLPSSYNRKQNHDRKSFFSDKIKQYHMIIGGGGA